MPPPLTLLMGQSQSAAAKESPQGNKRRKLNGSVEPREYPEEETREFSEGARSAKAKAQCVGKFKGALYNNPYRGDSPHRGDNSRTAAQERDRF